MVRLHSTEPGDSAHPQVVDHLLANTASGNKRSRAAASAQTIKRTSSSLDYKLPGVNNNRGGGDVGNNWDVVTPKKSLGPNNSNKNNERSQPNDNQSTEQQQHRAKITTRARGSGGIPPRKAKLELSDLAGMSEEEIMQALYSDPELAEQAAEKIARSQQRQKGADSNTQQQQNAKPKRGSGGTDRIDSATKEKGIPYEQWGVLLLLFGIGLYHVYKSMAGPIKSNSNSKRSSKVVDDVDKVVAEIEGTSSGKTSSYDNSTKQKKSAIAKNKKKKPATVTTSSSGSGAKKSSSKPVAAKDNDGETDSNVRSTRAPVAPIHSRGIISADDYGDLPIEDDVWETVSKSKGSAAASKQNIMAPQQQSEGAVIVEEESKSEKAAKRKEKKVVKAEQAVTNGAASDQATEPYSQQVVAIGEEHQSLTKNEVDVVTQTGTKVNGKDGNATSTAASSKKKKKKKGTLSGDKNANGQHNGNSAVVAGDAALALQLQKEEEQLAAASLLPSETSGYNVRKNGKAHSDAPIGGTPDDIWEEVATKKKKMVTKTEKEE